jgi:tRNA(fMet)-specific endonuclease VapC
VNLKYLLDTNVVSEPLRSNPAAAILRRLRRHEGETAIAATVWHELQFGCARLPRSRRKAAIERYLEEVVLASFPILDYGRAAAEWHAVERARLEAAGKTPPFVDGQIAAIASVNDLVLVTSNKSDFRGFRGLRVQSWA